MENGCPCFQTVEFKLRKDLATIWTQSQPTSCVNWPNQGTWYKFECIGRRMRFDWNLDRMFCPVDIFLNKFPKYSIIIDWSQLHCTGKLPNRTKRIKFPSKGNILLSENLPTVDDSTWLSHVSKHTRADTMKTDCKSFSENSQHKMLCLSRQNLPWAKLL